MNFYTAKERTVTDIITFTKHEFISALKGNKPDKLYNTEWSVSKPLYFLKDYSDKGCFIACSSNAEIGYIFRSWDDIWQIFRYYLKTTTDTI